MTKTRRRKTRKKASPRSRKKKVEAVDYAALMDSKDKPLPFQFDGDEPTAVVPPPPTDLEENPPLEEVDEPSSSDLMANAARKAAAEGDLNRAASIYRELLSTEPERVEIRFAYALALKQMGQADEADELFTACIKNSPDSPSYLTARGALRTDRGRYADALVDLQAALDLNPASVDTHFHLGVLMSKKGLWTDALPFLRRSIELDPGCGAAYLHLGDALNHCDDLEGALQAFQRCAELGPTNAKAFYGLGVVYDRLNQPDDAAAMYRRSREMALL